ncbi:hypothetical protein DFH06DRAFT_1347114 [Mycena polygramma]|nr:hypothetical protein DFH06DRAFT_1347114 [Mycena polygramma]
MLTIFFTNIVMAILPAYMMVTFGPKLGLRQMMSALLSAINTIAAVQTLRGAADDTILDAAGVVIVAVHGFFCLPVLTCWLLLRRDGGGDQGRVMGGDDGMGRLLGQAAASNVLSFIGVVFEFAVGWVSLASDYNVYQSAETPAWKTIPWTYAGLILPLVLIEWSGNDVSLGA